MLTELGGHTASHCRSEQPEDQGTPGKLQRRQQQTSVVRLKGRAGEDTFRFSVAGDKDKIKDFEDGLDKIDLSGFGFANAAEVKVN